MSDDTLFDQALMVIEDCAAWPQATARLAEHGLIERLGAAGMERLNDAWRRRLARELDDRVLASELAWWAAGGTFAHHLSGFNAPPPGTLIDEAARRGWFVRDLPGGRAVVNPPTGKPITLSRGIQGAGG